MASSRGTWRGANEGSFRLKLVMSLVYLAVLSGSLVAGVRVLDNHGNDIPSSAWTATHDSQANAWTIRLTDLWNPWGNSWYRVQVDSGDAIARLVIDVDGPPAGSPVTVTVGEAGPPVTRVDVIEQTGSAEVILHQLNVVESLGAVTVQAINFIDVGGHVHGPLITTDSSNISRGIRSLDIAGDLLGDVLVSDGTIRLIKVLGDIGTPTSPVRIEAGQGLWTLDVRGDVWADVDLCATGHTGFLHRLEADAFHGSLRVDRLDRPTGETEPPSMILEGWLSGTWTFNGPLQDEEAIVQLPPHGLRGQVIINAQAALDAAWTTPVRLVAGEGMPPIVLNGPTYDHMPSVVGGGSIGLVPYRLHAAACAPPSGTLVPTDVDDLVVQLRFFGAVDIGWGAPLSFERRPIDSVEAFQPVPVTDFCVEQDAVDSRTVLVSAAGPWGGFQAGWTYRVRPTSYLLCDQAVQVPVSDEVVYWVELETSGCDGDIDDS
ncbi:MAG: hypothetical protein VX527_04670, partial [Planctomycetota bacterium]|nr:hypothetical protein [Planctomycetota bacterium]